MQAVILVGGEGTRLRPLTYAVPKPMAPLLGRPFIGWIIERLRAAGVDEIILSCCYMPEALEAHFGDGSEFGIKLHYVFEEEPLGTAGAVKNAVQKVKGTFYVCNGDILTALDLVALREAHRKHGAIATIHTRAVEDPRQFGVVETDSDGRVKRFVEKPQPGDTDARDINAGTYVLEPDALDAIPSGQKVSIERETFPKLIAQTKRVFAFSTSDYWIDVGRPQTYTQAHRDILDGRFERPLGTQVRAGLWSADGRDLSPQIAFTGPVYIGAGVEVGAGAQLGPYAVLYSGCRVGERATISSSILWSSCYVGAHAQVRDAILGLDVAVDPGVTVEPGSIVGRGERIGEKARTPL
ncbi:MAG: NDP-sugar synthase [Candidatus Eremiobacteraeota bacterium]|nr:NDP-sugar synthase [Candidatus Eremiobacteraeota bacterium]